jgi:hypothetical protein
MALKLERYEMQTIRRSQIHGAEYNPRKIGDAERTRLRKGIKKAGLVQPLVWNRRTGTLVSGHQRLSIMDRLVEPEERSADGAALVSGQAGLEPSRAVALFVALWDAVSLAP